jgi:hypothetical protein
MQNVNTNVLLLIDVLFMILSLRAKYIEFKKDGDAFYVQYRSK